MEQEEKIKVQKTTDIQFLKEQWDNIKRIRSCHDLSTIAYNTWIARLDVYAIIDDIVLVLVRDYRNREYISYLKRKYAKMLQEEIKRITGNSYELYFVTLQSLEDYEIMKNILGEEKEE